MRVDWCDPTDAILVLYEAGFSATYIRMVFNMKHPEYTGICKCDMCEYRRTVR